MPATWIVSANASRARIFAQQSAEDEIEEVTDMVNEATRLRAIETESDKIGPTSGTKSIHNTGGATPNKLYQPPVSPEKHQAELFARDISNFLLKAAQEGRYQELDLVASPKFLGALRELLDPQVMSLVKVEINKDYTHLTGEALRDEVKAKQRPH
jgi:protein required for attachment to host cells